MAELILCIATIKDYCSIKSTTSKWDRNKPDLCILCGETNELETYNISSVTFLGYKTEE